MFANVIEIWGSPKIIPHLLNVYTIFTARIRRIGEGTVFSLSVHTSTGRGGGVPDQVPVKGKNFDTRFGLIHVQIGKKKNFEEGPPPTPPVKGKNFDTRFGLIHVQTGKKNFRRGTPPPPVKGKFFDTRFGLIHVQTGKFFFAETPPPGIVSTCYGYAAGGVPLAFTQEDFLVLFVFLWFWKYIIKKIQSAGWPKNKSKWSKQEWPTVLKQ